MIALLLAAALSQSPAPEKTPEVKKPVLGFSLMPPKLDLGPPAKSVECAADMLRFSPESVPFDEPKSISYTEDGKKMVWRLRPGILMSECAFVGVINTKVEHKRLTRENEALKSLEAAQRRQYIKAEESYQETIKALQNDLREANEPSLWEHIDGPVMFGLGVVATGLVVWGSVEVYKAIDR